MNYKLIKERLTKCVTKERIVFRFYKRGKYRKNEKLKNKVVSKFYVIFFWTIAIFGKITGWKNRLRIVDTFSEGIFGVDLLIFEYVIEHEINFLTLPPN